MYFTFQSCMYNDRDGYILKRARWHLPFKNISLLLFFSAAILFYLKNELIEISNTSCFSNYTLFAPFMYTFEFEYLCIMHVLNILYFACYLLLLSYFFSGKSYLTGVTCYQLI